MTLVHVSLGGPMRTIQVNGIRFIFEMHPYCGPTILNRRGEPAKNQPSQFLHAASLWAQQGQKVDDSGLCVWEHPAEDVPILKRVSRRASVVTGWTKIAARKGE